MDNSGRVNKINGMIHTLMYSDIGQVLDMLISCPPIRPNGCHCTRLSRTYAIRNRWVRVSIPHSDHMPIQVKLLGTGKFHLSAGCFDTHVIPNADCIPAYSHVITQWNGNASKYKGNLVGISQHSFHAINN